MFKHTVSWDRPPELSTQPVSRIAARELFFTAGSITDAHGSGRPVVLKWNIASPKLKFSNKLCWSRVWNQLVKSTWNHRRRGYRHIGNTCYIGVGARTTISAVKNLSKIGVELEHKGIQTVAVVNKGVAEAEVFGRPPRNICTSCTWICSGSRSPLAW